MFQTNLRKVRLTAKMWPVFLEEISNTDSETQLSLLHLDECWPPDNAIEVNIIIQRIYLPGRLRLLPSGHFNYYFQTSWLEMPFIFPDYKETRNIQTGAG